MALTSAVRTRILVFVPLLSVLLAGCAPKGKGPGGGAGGGGGFKMPPTPVEMAVANVGVVRDEFNAVGTIEAGEQITVTSEINGIVHSLPFTEGSSVGKGQLLAQIDDTELKARLDRAQALVEQNTANFNRTKNLMDKGAVAQQQLDDSQAALKVAEADLALQKAQIARTRISAPFSGIVGARKISPGAYVKAGDPITDLAQVEEIKVSFPAPERYLGQLVRGAAVSVTAPAFPGTTLTGRIDVIEPVLDASTRNAKILARVANPDRLFRPGMSANVSVVLAERPQALTIPSESVFVQGDQAFVYTINPDSSVAQSPVKLGTRTAGTVEVLSGLEPGATVVATGHQKLYPGAHVMPMPGAGAPTGGNPPGEAAAGGEKS